MYYISEGKVIKMKLKKFILFLPILCLALGCCIVEGGNKGIDDSGITTYNGGYKTE